jgi:large subunit ribosomal protein L30e
MIDITRALKTAAATGDVRFGIAETRKAMKKGEAKLVVVSSNCPDSELVSGAGATRVYRFQGTNVELGSACGVPYSISALAVVSPGESNILSA